MTEALIYALRVAKALTRDPEGESLAGLAAWYAYRTFDPTKNVPWRRWVAICVKGHLRDYWKYKRTESWVETTTIAPMDSEPIDELLQTDWQLLVESFIDKWPMDVIARRRGITIYQVKYMIRAAVARLERIRNAN